MEKTKTCSKCKKTKSVNEFYKYKEHKDGLRYYCKKCDKEQCKKYYKNNSDKIKMGRNKYYKNNPGKIVASSKLYYEKNKKKIKKATREYYENNKEKAKEYNKEYYTDNVRKIKETTRKYRKNNKEKIRKYQKEYRKNNKEKIRKAHNKWESYKMEKDPIFRLNKNIHRGINLSLKNKKRGKPWEKLVGYTITDLLLHLESQFQEGMTWENYGIGEGKWNIDHCIPISVFNITSVKCKGFKACWALNNLRPMWAVENIKKNNKILY